jgi:hypothetical protein
MENQLSFIPLFYFLKGYYLKLTSSKSLPLKYCVISLLLNNLNFSLPGITRKGQLDFLIKNTKQFMDSFKQGAYFGNTASTYAPDMQYSSQEPNPILMALMGLSNLGTSQPSPTQTASSLRRADLDPAVELSQKRLVLDENEYLRDKHARLARDYADLQEEVERLRRLGGESGKIGLVGGDGMASLEELKREKATLARLLHETADENDSLRSKLTTLQSEVSGLKSKGPAQSRLASSEDSKVEQLHADLNRALDNLARKSSEAKGLEAEVDKWKGLHDGIVRDLERQKLDRQEERMKIKKEAERHAEDAAQRRIDTAMDQVRRR